jgi:hypothetical protein
MKQALGIGLGLMLSLPAWGQRVSGYITEQGSGEPLGYAVVADSAGRTGAYSNLQGYFTLLMQPGRHVLHISAPGYRPQRIFLNLSADSSLSVAMARQERGLDTVAIEGARMPLQPGRLTLSAEQLMRVPAIGGEADILKSLQLTPGVTFGLEGSGNLFVRGGSPDQNLVLLDEMPVYNVNHLFGYFSVFPAEAIKTVSLLKGNFPARYGGRLSSVLEVQVRDGNLNQWKKSVSLSTLSSHLCIEGPLAKEKSAMMFTLRRSWLDLLLRPASAWAFRRQDNQGFATYGFYDLVGKINFLTGPDSRLSLSIYGGQDRGSATLRSQTADSSLARQRSSLEWGNLTLSLRYQRIIRKHIFFHTTLGYTQYRHENEATLQIAPPAAPRQAALNASNRFGSQVQEALGKAQLEWRPSERHFWVGGAQFSWRAFRPNLIALLVEENRLKNDTLIFPEKTHAFLASLFVEYEWRPDPRLSLQAGIRAEAYLVRDHVQTDPQPRLSLSYRLSDRTSINASYSRIMQHLHLLTSNGIGLQADIWTPATSAFPPARSQQLSAGVFHGTASGIQLSAEAYVKTFRGVLEYKDGASLSDRYQDWEEKVLSGDGLAYGLELFAHKPSGRLNGWMSYTLSWNYRTFEGINGGAPFPFRYDRRHNFNVFLAYILPGKDANRSFSVSWTYLTGARASIPTSVYATIYPDLPYISGSTDNILALHNLYEFYNWALYSPQRNNLKMRDFHKLDIAYEKSVATRRGNMRKWGFGMYNVYGQRNPYFLLYSRTYERADAGNDVYYLRTGVREYSILSWIPYVNYSYHF